MRILAFGDSITHGLWDPAGGWVQRIRSAYDTQTISERDELTSYPDVYNLGVSGDTAGQLARRIAPEIKFRKAGHPAVVVAIGINDTMIYKGVEVNTPEMFTEELRQIVSNTRPYTDVILFVGMHPVNEEQCCPWKYAPQDTRFLNDRIWQFETSLRGFCKQAELSFVELYEHFDKKNKEDGLLADGLHPNEKGHQLIAEIVRPAIDTLII